MQTTTPCSSMMLFALRFLVKSRRGAKPRCLVFPQTLVWDHRDNEYCATSGLFTQIPAARPAPLDVSDPRSWLDQRFWQGHHLKIIAHCGRASPHHNGPALFARNRYRGISTSSDVARPDMPRPDLRRSKYLRGFSRRLKTAPTRGHICPDLVK